MDWKPLVEELSNIAEGLEEAKPWFGYEKDIATLLEAASKLSGLDKALDRINEGLQTGETRDALVEAKYLLIDGR